MLRLTCILTFPDRETVTGETRAESPQGENRIIYTGAIERLPRVYERGSPADLKLYFENLATELQGTVRFMEAGSYDRWAE